MIVEAPDSDWGWVWFGLVYSHPSEAWRGRMVDARYEIVCVAELKDHCGKTCLAGRIVRFPVQWALLGWRSLGCPSQRRGCRIGRRRMGR
jgi:hypothetical protein